MDHERRLMDAAEKEDAVREEKESARAFENTKLQQRCDQLQEEVDALNQRLCQAHSEITLCKENCCVAKATAESLRAQLSEHEECKKDKQRLQERVHSLQSGLQDAQAALNRYRQEHATALADAKSKSALLRSELDGSQKLHREATVTLQALLRRSPSYSYYDTL